MTLSGPRAEQQQRYKHSSSSANIKLINRKDLQDGKKKEDGHKEPDQNGHSESDKKSTPTTQNEGPTKKPSENLRTSKKEERKKKESKKIDAKKKDLLPTGDSGQQQTTSNTSYGASNTSVSPNQTFISSSSSGGYHHHSHHANVSSNTSTNPNPMIDSRLSQEAQSILSSLSFSFSCSFFSIFFWSCTNGIQKVFGVKLISTILLWGHLSLHWAAL